MKVHGEYTCEICGMEFDTNVNIAAHVSAHQRSLTETEILDAIRTLAEQKGRAPTIAEMNADGACSSFPVIKRFGTWNHGIRAAGLEPNVEPNISRESLLGEIRSIADSTGATPTLEEFLCNSQISAGPIYNRFGSWNAALQAADLSPNIQFDIAGDEVLKAIQQLGEELGRAPKAFEMDAQGKFSAKIAQRRFGSWNDALRQAGFEPNLIQSIPDEDLYSELKRVAQMLGRVPTVAKFIRHGRFSIEPYQRRFDTWEEALNAAGLQISTPSTVQFSRPGSTNLYYGPNWRTQRAQAVERNQYQCQHPGCGITAEVHHERFNIDLCVHHVVPIRTFCTGSELDHVRANALDNLVTLCRPHHRYWERMSPLQPDFRHL